MLLLKVLRVIPTYHQAVQEAYFLSKIILFACLLSPMKSPEMQSLFVHSTSLQPPGSKASKSLPHALQKYALLLEKPYRSPTTPNPHMPKQGSTIYHRQETDSDDPPPAGLHALPLFSSCNHSDACDVSAKFPAASSSSSCVKSPHPPQSSTPDSR